MSNATLNRLLNKQQAGDNISLGVASSKDSVATKKSEVVKKDASKAVSHSVGSIQSNVKSKPTAKADVTEPTSASGVAAAAEKAHDGSVSVEAAGGEAHGNYPNAHRKITCVRYIRPIAPAGRQQEQTRQPAQPPQICMIPPPPCYPCSPYGVNYCMTPYGCYPYPVYSSPYPICPPAICPPVCREKPECQDNSRDSRASRDDSRTRPIIITTSKSPYRRKRDDDEYYENCREKTSSEKLMSKFRSKKTSRSRMSNDDGSNPAKTKELMMKRYMKQSNVGSAAPSTATSKTSKTATMDFNTKVLNPYQDKNGGSVSKSQSGSSKGSWSVVKSSVKTEPGAKPASVPAAKKSASVTSIKSNSKSAMKVESSTGSSLPKESKSVVSAKPPPKTPVLQIAQAPPVNASAKPPAPPPNPVNVPPKVPPVKESAKTKALRLRQELDAKHAQNVNLTPPVYVAKPTANPPPKPKTG